VGQENSGAPANQQAAGQNANAPTPEQKAAMQSELADAKAKLDSLKGDLDIEQRKYALDEQTYISNPNHEMDKSGAANLQNEKDDIAAKQQEIADLQKKIEDLQAQAAAADNGGAK
jgi:chromosome segregation ATPase